ncbi:MAG: single-stranded-DNA-specific exonuclease RecJ [Sutterella wadsworthensis]|jgi:single-stranded-DNA-specific exonuclease recJ|nr:single-stranded-DNA-specific exonuclease RecJ [uncultured Sutterella sp.]MBS6614855.1 single-stranded-DNA-specific exonuclease RecJ [Sutterella wadsworthensis]
MTRILNREFDLEAARRLHEEGYLPPVARALSARGIRDASELAQDWKSMLPPAMLEGTREAAERLALARERGERVTVVADYDCDGATACAVAIRGLGMMGVKADYFVPHRVHHGYGLSCAVVDLLAARTPRPDVLLTVDNGVSSAEAVRHAAELGIDVIVTDHHLPGAELPPAVCIVNPNLADSAFPSKALAGVGVMYYVLLALRALLRERGVYTQQTQPRLDALVDLVALGTVADVVKLDKNNRILVAQGLNRIRLGRTHAGISALFAVAGKKPEAAGVRDFGFALGPRINAAGRLDTMENGIECLLADDPVVALDYARSLNDFNAARQELETEMQQAAETALSCCNVDSLATLTLYDGRFNEGVVGLVASRLKEKVNRPTIVFAPTDDGALKGSGRSIAGVHLRDALDLVSKALPGAVLRFGGHAMAAGLTLRSEGDLPAFRDAFEKAVRSMVDASVFERVIYTDGGLAPDEITERLVQAIDSQIWGQGFDAPVFANEFRVVRQSLVKDAHTKLILELGGQRFDAIFFRHTETLPGMVRLAYRPNINEFMGRRSVQLVIEAAEL